MNSEFKQLMQALRDDHRNMALVLDVLDNSIAAAESGENPDFELVDEIMRYMTVYPDAVHHPKEDVVYSALQNSRPDLVNGLEDVPADHREIAALGTKLRDDVEAVVAGAAVRRQNFLEHATEYVRRLREHIKWEEEDLFQRVEEMLERDAVTLDIDRFQHILDPVFELAVETAFRRLLESLKSE